MTDTTQLIERLKRADKNERRGWGGAYENAPIPTLWLEAASALEAKDKEIQDLREALKPATEVVETLDRHLSDDWVPVQTSVVKDLQSALAKLEGSGV